MEKTARYKPNVEVASDAEAVADRSVQLFVAVAREAVRLRGAFHVALSGGRTPARFFERLAVSPEAKALPWERVHVFWVDERYVPPDSQASNYRLAADGFLNKVGIPSANVHRIPTEHEDIREAAHVYEQVIREVFGLREHAIPEFDLVVLGMGDDGHTGSLFPNARAAFDVHGLVAAVCLRAGAQNRITLTPPALLAARRLAVLVCGPEKAHTLKDVLTSEPDAAKYPIQVLWPVLEKVTWLVDRDAARGIAIGAADSNGPGPEE